MKDSSFVCFDSSYSNFSVMLQTEKHTNGSHHHSWGYFKVFPVWQRIVWNIQKIKMSITEVDCKEVLQSLPLRLLLIPFLAFRLALHYTETFLFKATRDALSHKTQETKALCFSKAHNQPETEQNPKSLLSVVLHIYPSPQILHFEFLPLKTVFFQNLFLLT